MISAEFLKHHRRKVGLTQMELGKLLSFRSGQLISNIERGQAPFPPSRLKKLCKLLKVSQKDILEECGRVFELELKRYLK